MSRFLFFLPLFLISTLCASEYYYNNNQKVQLTPVDTNTTTIKARSGVAPMRYFKTPTQQVVGVNDQIIIKTDAIDAILLEFDLSLITQLSNDLYLLRVKKSTQIFEISNKLYEHDQVDFAHPNFTRKVQKR